MAVEPEAEPAEGPVADPATLPTALPEALTTLAVEVSSTSIPPGYGAARRQISDSFASVEPPTAEPRSVGCDGGTPGACCTSAGAARLDLCARTRIDPLA